MNATKILCLWNGIILNKSKDFIVQSTQEYYLNYKTYMIKLSGLCCVCLKSLKTITMVLLIFSYLQLEPQQTNWYVNIKSQLGGYSEFWKDSLELLAAGLLTPLHHFVQERGVGLGHGGSRKRRSSAHYQKKTGILKTLAVTERLTQSNSVW